MSIFNPSNWNKEVKNIDDETMNELDQRYINHGESVFDQNIQNLNVINLNIGNTGKLYFNDNTSQTTAYIPSFVTNQINNFLTSSNKFTNQNIFTNLNIEDGSSGIGMKIYQLGNDINIENMKTNGSILFKNNGITTSITTAGKMIIREISSDLFQTSFITMGNNFNIYSENGNTIFDSFGAGKEIYFRTMQANGINRGWNLIYNPLGVLHGMSNIITHSIESKSLKFRDNNTFALTNSQIFLSSTNDMVFDNRIVTKKSNMLFTNYNTAGVGKTITFDENANIRGVNDITLSGKITIGNNVTHELTHNSSGSNYIIDNNSTGGVFSIRNRDSGGIMREVSISSLCNMSGLNDLYCQRLYINNALINFTAYNDMLNRTSIISQSKTGNDDKVDIGTPQGSISLVPNNTFAGSYNSISKGNDSVIFFNNNMSIIPLTSGNVNTGGIRITQTETELYKPKVMNSLTFSDNSVQTTAMTTDYLTSFVNNLISQSQSSSSVPTGSIFAYVGDASNLPSGYLLCTGSQVSQTTFPNLFSAIGHKFLYGQTVGSNSFYLPDLRGAVLKGTGSGRFTLNNSMTLGEIQNSNVGFHTHQYQHNTASSTIRSASSGSTTTLLRPGLTTNYTTGQTFHHSSNANLTTDNLVNSVGVNYIIKF